MQHKNDYYTVGYIKTIYPVESNNGYQKRTFVVRNIFRKRNKWMVTDFVFVATGDCVEKLDLLYPNLEVIVKYSYKSRPWIKDGEHQMKNGKHVYFTELNAWDVFSHTDRKAKDDMWNIQNFQDVKPKDEDKESQDKQVNQDKIRRNPDNKTYKHETYDVRADYSDKIEAEEVKTAAAPDDDLPF